MGITIKKEIDYIYEAVLFLTLEYNEDLGPFYQGPEDLTEHLLSSYDVPSEVLSSMFENTQALYDHLREKIDPIQEDVKKFFTADFPHGISYGRLVFVFGHGDEKDVDRIVDEFLNMAPAKKQQAIGHRARLIFEPTFELSDETKEELNADKFYDYLDHVDGSEEIKWKALQFYRKFDEYLVGAADIVKKVIVSLKEKDSLINQMIEKGMKGAHELLKSPQLNERFREHYSLTLDFDKDIIVYPQVVTSNGVSLMSEDDSDMYLYIATLYDVITEMTEKFAFNVERVANDFKVLGDKRKFEILCKLRERPMYGQEIAESIGLTTATVSHHMSQLIEQQMVIIEKKEHRIYYEIHKEQFEKMLGHMRKLFVDI